MVEHFCVEHQVKYSVFKKGNDIWWSHQKRDGTWCNEKKDSPKLPEAKVEPKSSNKELDKEVSKPHIDNSRNRSVSLSYAKDLCANGVIDLKDVFEWADKFLEWTEK